MASFSLGTIWEEMVAFVRRESALLLPVAMATFALGSVILNLGMSGMANGQSLPTTLPGPQALLLLPVLLLIVYGNLAVSLIVLRPGISVGEALRQGLARLPATIGAYLLMLLGFLCIVVVATVAVTVVMMIGGGNLTTASEQTAAIMMFPLLFLWGRLVLLAPVLAVEHVGPLDGVRRAWNLARGNVWRLVTTFFVTVIVTLLFASIEQVVVGSLTRLLALAIGDKGLPLAIDALAAAATTALLSMAAAVFVALIYRRLAAASAQ